MKTEPQRMRDLGVGRRDCMNIPPQLIDIEVGHNPRNYNLPENRAHLNEIKESIKALGVQVPLLVRWEPSNKRAVLVDGECRLTATLELISEGAKILSVPTLQVQGTNEAERLILALTSNTGKPLSKWEIGTAFKKLVNYGHTVEMIAQKMGYSARYVTESMDLSDAPEAVKQLLSLEAVTPSLALKTIRENGSDAGKILTERVRTARANNPKATAKRERKVTGIRLSGEDAAIVIKAVKKGTNSDDVKLAELCAEAFEILNAASVK